MEKLKDWEWNLDCILAVTIWQEERFHLVS